MKLDGLIVYFFGIKKKRTFLEEVVHHIIYMGYVVNQRSFIYCSVACSLHGYHRTPW